MHGHAARAALLTLALLAASLPLAAQGQAAGCAPPGPDATWSIIGVPVVCSDREITVRSIVIQGGGSLTLQRATLNLNADSDTQIGQTNENDGISLWGKGDRLTADHSTIRSVYPDKRALIDVGSSSTIRVTDSTMQDLSRIALLVSLTGEGVLEATFERNKFVDSYAGIWTGGVNAIGVTIRDNVFEGVDHPILADGQDLIEGNTIVGCALGIELIETSNPTIRQNTITNCAGGIACGNQCPTTPQSIHDNDIYANFNAPCAACPTGEAGFPGDGTNNWWGRSPPDASRLYQFDYDPWRVAPVHPERLPSASLGSIPATVAPGQSVSFSGSGAPSATFGFPITSYSWSFGDGAAATGATASHSYASPGTYAMEFTVKDAKGLSRMAHATVQVVQPAANRAPTVSSVSISPANPAAGQALTATSAASDPDGDALTTTYAWARNGQPQGDLTSSTVPSGRTAANDDWQVTVKARDPSGAEASRSASVHVAAPPSSTTTTTSSSSTSTTAAPTNRAPAVADASASPNPATVGQTVNLHLATSDADGDTLTTTWTLPDGTTRAGADATATFSTAGSKSIQYRVTDGKTPTTGTVSLTVTEPPSNGGSGAGGSGSSGGSGSGSGGDGSGGGSGNSGGSSSGGDGGGAGGSSGGSGNSGSGDSGGSGSASGSGSGSQKASSDSSSQTTSQVDGGTGLDAPKTAGTTDETSTTAATSESGGTQDASAGLDEAAGLAGVAHPNAAAQVQAGGIPWLWVGIGGVWLPGIALGAVLLRRRSRR